MRKISQMINYRWVICTMLFFATAINYMDRQVLSLTWKDFIAPEFHWTDGDYGTITALFSLFYAASQLFTGRFIDWMGTRKGYLWAIGIWSLGACLHALCGLGTEMTLGLDSAASLRNLETGSALAVMAATISVYYFVAARLVLAMGEAGNFPAAIKVTAEYFPKKDRAFATSIFNSGAAVGALIAPVTIPSLAQYFKSIGVGNGWEMAFILIGILGFVWMGFWIFIYDSPQKQVRVNQVELAYINQDIEDEKDDNTSGNLVSTDADVPKKKEKQLSILHAFTYRQTWSFVFGKFMTDGVWWFFLFWTPAYISDVYKMPSSDPTAQLLIFVLYAITMFSIIGGYLPTYFVDKKGMKPYAGRMRAMLIFAFFPLLALLAQPLGAFSYWYPIIIVGIVCAAHQSWSANIYSTVSDMFPQSAVGTIVGIGSMAGGISSMIINKGSGMLFDYSVGTATRAPLHVFGFEGKPAGYFIVFCICSVSYLIAWIGMKLLVPHYKKIEL